MPEPECDFKSGQNALKMSKKGAHYVDSSPILSYESLKCDHRPGPAKRQAISGTGKAQINRYQIPPDTEPHCNTSVALLFQVRIHNRNDRVLEKSVFILLFRNVQPCVVSLVAYQFSKSNYETNSESCFAIFLLQLKSLHYPL